MTTARILTVLAISAVGLAIFIACIALSPRLNDAGYEETDRLAIHETGITLRTALLIGAISDGKEIFQPDSDITTFPQKTPARPTRLITVAVGLTIGIVIAFTLVAALAILFPQLFNGLRLKPPA